jgi:hypothetical protein
MLPKSLLKGIGDVVPPGSAMLVDSQALPLYAGMVDACLGLDVDNDRVRLANDPIGFTLGSAV